MSISNFLQQQLPPWFYPFPETNTPLSLHFLGLTLLVFTLLFTLATYLYIKRKTRHSTMSGTKFLLRAYDIIFIAMLLMLINEIGISFGIIISNQEWTVFYLTNATPLMSGFILFVFATMNFVRNISVIRGILQKVVSFTYFAVIIVSTGALLDTIASNLGILSYTEAGLYGAILTVPAFFILILYIIGLVFAIFQIPSKLTKLRISLLTGAIACITITIIVIVQVLPINFFDFGSFFNSIEFYVAWHFYLIPFTMVILFLTANILLYAALFPPVWLQRHTGVLPPSFQDMMKKRQKLKNKGVE